MSMHDSPHFNPNGFQEDFADYVGGPPVDTSSEEPNFADAAGAPNGWILSEPGEDVATPSEPVCDPLVLAWTLRTYPKLKNTNHDATLNGLGTYFTRKGGWVYVTQDQVAAAAGLERTMVNRMLRGLIEVGLVQSKPIPTIDGKRGMAYRLAGEDCGWQSVDSFGTSRVNPETFRDKAYIAQLEEAVRCLAQNSPVVQEIPHNVVAVVSTVGNSSESELSNYSRSLQTGSDINTKAVVQKKLHNGLENPADHRPPAPASDRQANLIEKEMQRTGLEETDVLASWPDVDRYSEVPQGLDPTVMTSLQANRCIQWLAHQADKPAPVRPPLVPARPDQVCNCSEHPPELSPSDPAAADTWNAVLSELELEVPRATFETWLKQTRGIAFDGQDLLVEVPSHFAAEWLEQRMYQTILRALRRSSDQPLDVRFQTPPEPCPVHGEPEQVRKERT